MNPDNSVVAALGGMRRAGSGGSAEDRGVASWTCDNTTLCTTHATLVYTFIRVLILKCLKLYREKKMWFGK